MKPPMRLRNAFLMLEQSRLVNRETRQGLEEAASESPEVGPDSCRTSDEYRRDEEPGLAPVGGGESA
jgi:hypothetical protein